MSFKSYLDFIRLKEDCQVRVDGTGSWWLITRITDRCVYGCRWLKSKNEWDYGREVRIPYKKIYYVVQPQYQEDRS